MQRNLIIILILFSVLAAEGCRRGGVKREPINVVKESDLIFSTKKSELADAVRPIVKDKKEIQVPKEVLEAKRRGETQAVGEFLMQYRKDGKYTPPSYHHDDLKKSLRRQKKYDMYDQVNTKSIDVVYLSDPYNLNHVICYHRTPEVQEDVANKKNIQFYPAFRADGKLEIVLQEQMEPRVRNQEMQVAFYYYMTYAAPHFYRPGAELQALRTQLARQGEPFFLPAEPPQGKAPEFLAKLQQRKPDLIKNPPEKRDFNRFKRYLKENAPPQLLDYVENGTLVFDLNADLRTPGALVAVRGQPEPPKDQQNPPKEKYHFGVNTDGVIQAAYESAQVQPWIELRRREQDTGKGGMMGGMPGAMPPGGMPPGRMP